MREIEMLKRHQTQVFMNSGGGGGGASASSAAAASSSSNDSDPRRTFPHWFHIIFTIITAGLWIPVYFLSYISRDRRVFY
jgi:hypothetical protein